MKTLYSRLVIAYAVLLAVLLTGLGIVLGQFFYLFNDGVDIILQRQYLFYLIVVLVISFILSLFMATRILLSYAKPIDEVTVVASKIAKGNFHLPTPVIEPFDILSVSINKIAQNMKEMSKQRGMEQERLKTLIESMGSGLLMFGRGRTVNLVNDVFRKTFGFLHKEILGETVNTLGLPNEIESLIEKVFMTEQSSKIKSGFSFSALTIAVSPSAAAIVS